VSESVIIIIITSFIITSSSPSTTKREQNYRLLSSPSSPPSWTSSWPLPGINNICPKRSHFSEWSPLAMSYVQNSRSGRKRASTFWTPMEEHYHRPANGGAMSMWLTPHPPQDRPRQNPVMTSNRTATHFSQLMYPMPTRLAAGTTKPGK